ncbi:hypothetical protein LOAG_12522 [Loa loa]|uniref:Uncharacterized protein n=1 Tax=Loa loa TaxID=7209 RepID=A0A1S0TL18_LOALO|nr:hypothetical protein LOAG_12522 [Loa loa]EFO15987.1 hypothetical protein LOAG_12522 [Loa loa]
MQRSFLFGLQIVMILKGPFVPIRKKINYREKHTKESIRKNIAKRLQLSLNSFVFQFVRARNIPVIYLQDVIEVQEVAINPISKILLASSLKAAISLIEKPGGDLIGAFTLIKLAYLEPRKHVPEYIPIYSFITLTEYSLTDYSCE